VKPSTSENGAGRPRGPRPSGADSLAPPSEAARKIFRDFLTSVEKLEESQRSAEIAKFLADDLKTRRAAGERPDPSDYKTLLPKYDKVVDDVFESEQTQDIPSSRSSGPATIDYSVTNELRGHPTDDGGSGSKPTDAMSSSPGSNTPTGGATFIPRIPGYEILGELGKGGMGIVYKARDVQLNRVVALKMILPDRDHSKDRLDRFHREAAAIAKLSDPHLVQIFQYGDYEGRPFLVLEYLEGGALDRKLSATPQAPEDAVALIEALARGIERAHQHSIIHRDLKPSNVLLAADGTPKIGDFGLAKHLDDETTRTHHDTVVGTPAYMAPEQINRDLGKIGPATDVHALGTIFYEMLTGRPPFKAATKPATFFLVQFQEPIPPRRLVPQVPRDLELICLRCLQKDPRERFPSALELAEELRRFREGRPILTRPAPWYERAWKWCRRQPAAAAAIAVGLLAVASLGLHLYQAQREEKRTADIHKKVDELQARAETAFQGGDITNAEGNNQAALELLAREPSLKFMAAPVESLKVEIERKKDEDAKYAALFKHRDDAFYHGIFKGVDLAKNVAATKNECDQGLAIAAVDRMERNEFVNRLSPARRQKCDAACFEMLVLRAQAEMQGAKKDAAIRNLDLVASLGEVPPTRAYHLFRADCLEPASDARKRAQADAEGIEPSTALDFFLLADRELDRRPPDISGAIRHLTSALQKDPKHFWASALLGACELQTKRPDLALAHFNTCLTFRQDLWWLYMERGLANAELNRLTEADEDFRRALALDPDAGGRYGILRFEAELDVRRARTIPEIAPVPWLSVATPNVALPIRLAVEHFRRDRYDAAVRRLRDVIESQPESPIAYRDVARIRALQGDLKGAVGFLNEAVKRAESGDPKLRAELFGQRARICRQVGQLDAALDDLGKALGCWKRAEDYIERGVILHSQRKYTDAIKEYQLAQRTRPEGSDVWRADLFRREAEAWSALSLQAKREDRHELDEKAEAAYGGYFQFASTPSADAYRRRGQIRVALRKMPGAVSDYTQALKLAPEASLYVKRGWIFLATQSVTLALLDFEEAIERDPTSSEAFAGRGLIRVRLNQSDAAFDDAEAAEQRAKGGNALTYWNVAHVYAQLVSAPPGKAKDKGLNRAKCLNKALEMIRESLARVPQKERSDHWKQYVESDPLLHPIRDSIEYRNLEREVIRDSAMDDRQGTEPKNSPMVRATAPE
jgi:serine/threonine protein kinase/Tfp pilus assembly protein PilF